MSSELCNISISMSLFQTGQGRMWPIFYIKMEGLYLEMKQTTLQT